MTILMKSKKRVVKEAEWPKYKSALGSQRVYVEKSQKNGPGVFGKFIMQLILLTVSALIITASYHLAITHVVFDIKKVEVFGVDKVSTHDVLKPIQGFLRGNIFTANLENITTKIMRNPWIESASLVRRLPATVIITVKERKAAAIVVSGADKYLVDRGGIVLGKAHDNETSYLLITGVKADLHPGDEIEGAEYEDAFYVKELFDREDIFMDPIVEVNISNPDRLKAVTGKDGIHLSFGSIRDEWREKFLEYLAVRKIVASRGENVRSIDLSFRNQVVVVRGSQGEEQPRKEKNNFTL